MIALTLMSPQVTDAGLDNLKGLTNLTMLFLTSSKVGDKGLPSLKGLKNLQVLALSRTAGDRRGPRFAQGSEEPQVGLPDRHQGDPASCRKVQAGPSWRGGVQVKEDSLSGQGEGPYLGKSLSACDSGLSVQQSAFTVRQLFFHYRGAGG